MKVQSEWHSLELATKSLVVTKAIGDIKSLSRLNIFLELADGRYQHIGLFKRNTCTTCNLLTVLNV